MENGVVLGSEWGFSIAAIWGLIIAVFMRHTKAGRFMARHMMWFVVACGAGVDLLIVRVFFVDAAGMANWNTVVIVFFVSSIAIAGWSILDLATYFGGMLDGYRSE